MNHVRHIALPLALVLVLLPHGVLARDLGVVVNGTALVFDQPPLERGGRIYVPLRGLFERLGASVVFDAGRIAMTAGSHTIALHVGETGATIDGQLETLEAPPIVVAGRTLVPLRFVAQALGANVAYDGNTRVVSVDAAPLASASIAPLGPPPPAGVAVMTPSIAPVPPIVTLTPSAALPAGEVPIELRLLRVEPAPASTVARRRPELSATFAEAVDPATVRVLVDGRDLGPDLTASARSFVADPGSDLPSGTHTVTVTGMTPDKERFEERWSFATTDYVNRNYLSGLEPATGTTLGIGTPGTVAFEVSGFTRPRARVRLVATTSGTSASFGETTDDSQTVDVVASAKGYFAAPMLLADHGSGLVDVEVTSTAPGGGAAVRTLRLRL